jgi:hypothetical protein
MNFNVTEILERYSIEYKRADVNSEILYYCPFHNHSDDKMGSSLINEETGVFNCFACCEGGNIYKFVSKLENISYDAAYKLVSSNFGQDSEYDINKLKNVKIVKKIDSNLSQKIIFKILHNLIYFDSIESYHKWLIICNWIKMNKTNEKIILNIYDEFNKELSLFTSNSN